VLEKELLHLKSEILSFHVIHQNVKNLTASSAKVQGQIFALK